MSLALIGRSKHVLWHLESKKDPRWNASGRDAVAMMFQTAPSAARVIAHNKEKYGELPSDLHYTAHKE